MLQLVEKARPNVCPSPTFQEQLELWYKLNFKLYSVPFFQVPCDEYAGYLFRLGLEKMAKGY